MCIWSRCNLDLWTLDLENLFQQWPLTCWIFVKSFINNPKDQTARQTNTKQWFDYCAVEVQKYLSKGNTQCLIRKIDMVWIPRDSQTSCETERTAVGKEIWSYPILSRHFENNLSLETDATDSARTTYILLNAFFYSPRREETHQKFCLQCIVNHPLWLSKFIQCSLLSCYHTACQIAHFS